MDDHQIPWTLIMFCIVIAIWILRSVYRRYFGAHNQDIMRFEIADHVIEFSGDPESVRKAHYDVFHGKIDHRNQVTVREWNEPIWWTFFLASRPKRLEAHVVRADQFQEAVLLLHKAKQTGLKIEGRIRPLTAREARTTRDAESAREAELFEQGQIAHPRDRAWLGGFVGPKRDRVRKISSQRPTTSAQQTDRTIVVNSAKPRNRRPRK